MVSSILTRVLAVCALVAAMAVWQPSSALAADTEDQRMIVLDLSDSMNEYLEDSSTTKITAAKDALSNAVDAMPDTTHIGFRTFGGGCTDTRLETIIGPIKKDSLKRTIDTRDPEGGTPLAYGLERAGKDFTTSGRKSILLVSDGEETCGGDPVAVARNLASSGINLCIDVIGFRVDSTARDQLRAVADAACGTFYDVDDGPQLGAQLQKGVCARSEPWTVISIDQLGGMGQRGSGADVGAPRRSGRDCE
ncbi:MAG: VWA domain-containing protein [Corynebacteriales bacterium]|nr:VWA domain-containing protein [Mycobacteriales bacterium]